MVGGNPAACEAVKPLLLEMGKEVIYAGKHGAGGWRSRC
jgi:3-hydroxyisobutyrate dehydrogenase-like beta-hydroxyacid dehydrogenase